MGNLRSVFCLMALVALAITCHAQDVKTFPVSGKMLMPDGSPASGALVEARSIAMYSDWKTDATATSGDDGAFTMQLAPGSYRVCAVSGSFVYLDQAQMIGVAADGALSKPIEMRLEKGCKVEGVVIDTSTDQPVGGVRIITRDGDSAESSDDGDWSMVLRKGNHTITAMKDGYWWPIKHFSASGDTVVVKVEIKPGGTIKGRVLNEEGQPIAGARLGTSNTGYFSSHRATADAEGRFVLPGQDPDTKGIVSASAKGYDRLHDHPITFAAGEREVEVELTLKKVPTRTISGRVTRQDGTPVEGATVGYGLGTNFADYTTAAADKDGNYTLVASFRKNLVVASGTGYAPAYKQVEADEDVQMDFTLKPGHTVEGCVEDEDGNPLAGARLSLSMDVQDAKIHDNYYASIGYAVTDSEGRFKLENLPETFVYADVYANGYESISNERLKVDRKDYTLVLRKTVPGHICGTVVKDSDGEPLTEFNVRLDFSRSGGSSSGLTFALSREGVTFRPEDGKFSVKGLKVKEGYQVVVTAPGYMQASIDPVTVRPVAEEAYKDLVIRLRPSSPFEGTITEAGTDRPLEGVMVAVWDTASFGSNVSFTWDMSGTSLKSVSTRTDAEGKFRFDSMPFSSGAVMLEKGGFARTLLRRVRFSRPFQASLEKGAAVTGSVADENGQVQPGTYLNLEYTDANLGFRPVPLGPDGSFTVTDLPPGDYWVGQYKEGRQSRRQFIELKADETHRVDWVNRGAVTVQGKVLQNAKPVLKAKINVNLVGERRSWAGSSETGEDGSYSVVLHKPGTYSFSCILGEWVDPNHIYSTKKVELAAGTHALDFDFPYGSISGKIVDNQTGQPLTGAPLRLYVRETYEQRWGGASLHSSEVNPKWWPMNKSNTDSTGSFKIDNLRAGEWMICTLLGKRADPVPTGIVKLAEGEAKSGFVGKVPQTGSAAFKFADVEEMPLGRCVCMDDYGMAYYPKWEDGKYSLVFDALPAGKLRAVFQSDDCLPTETPFEVRPGETSEVTIKLVKGPRIIFQPKIDSDDVTEPVNIAYKITTPEGKPVLRGPEGPVWGGVLGGHRGSAGPLSITIEPGTYIVSAWVSDDPNSAGSETGPPHWSGTVTVEAGEDTVVEIPWDE